MGEPKNQRRKYTTPAHMFKGREGESELVQAYGLKNMTELWKAKSEIARVRGLARKLLATPDKKTETEIVNKLINTGLLKEGAKLEDVFNITIEGLLDRRLQTVAYKKSLTTTIKQARQEIVHGHISVKGNRMNAPGHIMTLDEEAAVDFYAGSKLSNPEHPIRKIEKKASTEKAGEEAASRDVKAGEVKPPSERPIEAPKKIIEALVEEEPEEVLEEEAPEEVEIEEKTDD